jgi:signal transduction histidine kinase
MKFSLLTSIQDEVRPDTLHEKKVVAALHALDVSLINHDIKTHLSPIKMCAEMLESHIPGPLNDKQERMVKTIHRCMDKLEKLVGDVSDVYKLESHSLHMIKTDVDIQNFMDNCIHLLHPFIAEKQIELKMESGAHGTIHADEKRIGQVLVHLVKNAVDHVPETGGKITITVEKGQDSSMLFSVLDNGKGVPQEDSEKIFAKFYKGESQQAKKYGGSGLGLAICRGIIQEHGGTIWLDSEQQNGAMFKFTIPSAL